MSTNTGEMARSDDSGMHEPSLHDHELNRRGFLSGLAAVAKHGGGRSRGAVDRSGR